MRRLSGVASPGVEIGHAGREARAQRNRRGRLLPAGLRCWQIRTMTMRQLFLTFAGALYRNPATYKQFIACGGRLLLTRSPYLIDGYAVNTRPGPTPA